MKSMKMIHFKIINYFGVAKEKEAKNVVLYGDLVVSLVDVLKIQLECGIVLINISLSVDLLYKLSQITFNL